MNTQPFIPVEGRAERREQAANSNEMHAEHDTSSPADMRAERRDEAAESNDVSNTRDREMTEPAAEMRPDKMHEAREQEDRDASYLPEHASGPAGERWQQIQATFVDDPRKAVSDAHELVGELTQRIVDAFAKERSDLERQWSKGDEVSTEELRVCLQRYRAFFSRLLPSVGDRSAN